MATAIEAIEGRLAELRTEDASLIQARAALFDKGIAEKRALTDVEETELAALGEKREAVRKQIVAAEARKAELDEAAKRANDVAEVRRGAGVGGAKVTDPEFYARGNHQANYFRDFYRAHIKNDFEAMDRISRASKQSLEARAISTAAGASGGAGELAPPKWMIDEVAKLARAGRVLADSLNPMTLPDGMSSINIPTVTQGTSTAVQATQNTALTQQDLTTSSVSSGIATYGGKAVSSQQMLDQAGLNMDELILQDIAADYARTFDTAVLTGSGSSGQLKGILTQYTAGTGNAVTFTSASPTAALFMSKLIGAVSNIQGTRFLPADVIYMHPRRWYWLLAQSDSQGRPLVTPTGGSQGFNSLADGDTGTVQGVAGHITALAMPVIIDPNIPTNLGAGTNQDVVIVARRGDLRLYESDLRMEVFRETYADSVGVLFRGYAYSAFISNRYTTAVSRIDGTGLVAPTF